MPATAAPGAGVRPGRGAPAAAGGEVHDITMPKLGETVTEGTVGSWLKNVGDAVAFDDPLFEVSTDKVDSEIPSPYDGVILEILVQAGETVPVGTPVARIGEPGAAPAAGGGAPRPHGGGPAATAAAAPATAAPATASANGGGTPLSPLVRRLAAENNLDLAKVPGSGVGGRIRREDVEKAIAGGGATATAAPAAAPARGGRRSGDHPAASGRARAPPRRRRPAATRATRCSRSRGCGWRSRAGSRARRCSRRACGPPSRSTTTTSTRCGPSTRTGSRRRPAPRCRTCPSSRGRWSTRCGRSRRSTPRSTSRPRP